MDGCAGLFLKIMFDGGNRLVYLVDVGDFSRILSLDVIFDQGGYLKVIELGGNKIRVQHGGFQVVGNAENRQCQEQKETAKADRQVF